MLELPGFCGWIICGASGTDTEQWRTSRLSEVQATGIDPITPRIRRVAYSGIAVEIAAHFYNLRVDPYVLVGVFLLLVAAGLLMRRRR